LFKRVYDIDINIVGELYLPYVFLISNLHNFRVLETDFIINLIFKILILTTYKTKQSLYLRLGEGAYVPAYPGYAPESLITQHMKILYDLMALSGRMPA